MCRVTRQDSFYEQLDRAGAVDKTDKCAGSSPLQQLRCCSNIVMLLVVLHSRNCPLSSLDMLSMLWSAHA